MRKRITYALVGFLLISLLPGCRIVDNTELRAKTNELEAPSITVPDVLTPTQSENNQIFHFLFLLGLVICLMFGFMEKARLRLQHLT